MADSYNASSVNSSKDNISSQTTNNSKSSSTAGSPQAALSEGDIGSKKEDGEKEDDKESEGSTKIKEMIKDIDGAQIDRKENAPNNENKSTDRNNMETEGKNISIANTSSNTENSKPTVLIQQ